MTASRSLPSLNALRAFEAVARHRSFSKAAEELHVTPGAVSHQIGGLENALGIVLFRRDARTVTLTAAAEACLPKLSEAFASMRDALDLLRDADRQRPLILNVAPAFATRWLLPRLQRFAEVHPGISLRLSTGLGLIDALRPEASTNLGDSGDQGAAADLAIRFGRGHYPGSRADKLFDAAITPVCSPRLLTGAHPLRTPDDLRHAALLHDDTMYFGDARPDWQIWLEAAGVAGIDAARGPHFSHTGLALDAAADGFGVALGISLLTAEDIASGRLVAPFDLALPSQHAYYLVCADNAAERPDVSAFRDWLLAEAAAV